MTHFTAILASTTHGFTARRALRAARVPGGTPFQPGDQIVVEIAYMKIAGHRVRLEIVGLDDLKLRSYRRHVEFRSNPGGRWPWSEFPANRDGVHPLAETRKLATGTYTAAAGPADQSRKNAASTMAAFVPHRRSFLGRLRTSILKRRVRLRRWLARIREHGDAPLVCRYFGADFVVMPGEFISDEIAINRYEWGELIMMLKACRHFRPDAFIDVGANIGLYTCVLGRARSALRVFAFEPDHRNFARLAENIARNGLAEIVAARPVAIGATAGTAVLIPAGPQNSGLSKLGDAGEHGYVVAVATLDDEVDLRNGMICLKIDVEGHELEVLSGAGDLLVSNGGYAQIEGHGDARAAAIIDIMRGYGWQFLDRHALDLRFTRARPSHE